MGHRLRQCVVIAKLSNVRTPTPDKHRGIGSQRTVRQHEVRQLARCITLQTTAKIGHQNAQQQVAQAWCGVGIAELRLHQVPERWSQVIGRNVLPGFGLHQQVSYAVHYHRRIQALQHSKQFRLVGAGQHRQHLAVQVMGVVAR